MGRPGSIHEIYVKDFVTYKEVTYHPKSNLNIIIGSNGTGKSTIVAAIILGLGGSPKMIGRGSKVSEYVRHTCKEANITITLYGSGSDHFVISRTFNTNNANVWKLNGRVVHFDEIRKINDQFNIQVDNLCQFLPQDRVQDFAKMNKNELLVNTQKALGRQDLVEKHEQLIKMQTTQKSFSTNREALLANISQTENTVARLQSKVQNLQVKRKQTRLIERIRRKIAWLKYKRLEEQHRETEQDWKKAKELIEKQKKKMQPLENKLQRTNEKIENVNQKLETCNSMMKTCKDKIQSLSAEVDSAVGSESRIMADMRIKLNELRQHREEADRLQNKMDKLINDEKDQLERYGKMNVIQEKVHETSQHYTRLKNECDALNSDKLSCKKKVQQNESVMQSVMRRLADLDNVKNSRLELLKRRNADAYKVVLWVRENKQLFRGAVYEPMMLELDVIDRRHAKYLENIVSMRDRVAFVCEYREDMNTLLRNVRDQLGLSVNVLHSGPEHPPLSSYRPNHPIEQLRPYGLHSYVLSLVRGPEALLKYLCRMYKLHNIPIGDSTTDTHAHQVPSDLRLFFSERSRYVISFSRYTNERSTRITFFESDNTLSLCVDGAAVAQAQEELERVRRQKDVVQAQLQELEQQEAGCREHRDKTLREMNALKGVTDHVNLIRERMRALQTALRGHLDSQVTVESVREQFHNKLKNILRKFPEMQRALCLLHDEQCTLEKKKRLLKITVRCLQNQVLCYENESADVRGRYETTLQNFQTIDTIYRRSQKAVQDAHKVASEGDDTTGRPEDETDVEVVWPTTQEGLEALLADTQAKMECLMTADAGEADTYERNLRQLEQLRAELQQREQDMSTQQSRLSSLHSEWFDQLQRLVGKISERFSEHFATMNCAGEVQVSRAASGDVEDYESYGLSVRVTFRSEQELQELSRHVQSGGERAVTTAAYMLAMQEQVAVPFRCIDEINQGMDPQNERNVFKIIGAVTAANDSCQYFLVTPKLLSDLAFDKSMQICIVHNGPTLNCGTELDLATIKQQRNNRCPSASLVL